MHKFMVVTLCSLALSMAACAPIQPVSPSADATPAPAEAPASWPAIVEAARAFLAGELAVAADAIQVVSVEAVDWPDGCLGIRDPDVMCMMVITPGYRVLLAVGNTEYTLHTNADGSEVRLAPNGPATIGPRLPVDAGAGVALPAPLNLEQLAAAVELDPATLTVTAVQAVDWPDACLGVYNADEMCATVITPGYRIVVTVEDAQVVLHTNADGSSVRAAEIENTRN